MIGETEIDRAIDLVRFMDKNGPNASDYLTSKGFDQEAIWKYAEENAHVSIRIGLIPPSQFENHIVAWGMGFLMAVILLKDQEGGE